MLQTLILPLIVETLVLLNGTPALLRIAGMGLQSACNPWIGRRRRNDRFLYPSKHYHSESFALHGRVK